MGSKNGKYDFHHASVLPNRRVNEALPFSSSELNNTVIKRPITVKTIVQNDLSTNESERVSLVWLDSEVFQLPANVDMEVKLKNLFEYVRLFDRVDLCEKYIKQIGKFNTHPHLPKEELFVIISTSLAPTIIPHLHDLSQVKYVYIYGKAKSLGKEHQRWLTKYKKLRGVFSSSRTMIGQLTRDLNPH